MNTINKIALTISIVVFVSNGIGYATDKKEEIATYINKISPILINVQVSSMNASKNLSFLQATAKQISGYIKDAKAIKAPIFMARQHKMILLGLSKIKLGFHILAAGDKKSSVPLLRRGVELLKTAGPEIKAMAEKEGLFKDRLKAQDSKLKGEQR